MKQEQIQRKRHARGGRDNEPDDIPTESPEHAVKASRDASDILAKIERETSNGKA
jgi:hypothetical protein